jgi:hypothetical protein
MHMNQIPFRGERMKILKKLWGLLVDDNLLASILLITVILAAAVSEWGHMAGLGVIVLWLGLLVSLTVSIEHQLNVRTKSKQ